MSYDITIGDFNRNHTWNYLGALCYDCLDEDTGIRALHGLRGSDAEPMISHFFDEIRRKVCSFHGDDMQDFIDKYRAQYNNSNWGSVVSAVMFMSDLRVACIKHPEEILQVHT